MRSTPGHLFVLKTLVSAAGTLEQEGAHPVFGQREAAQMMRIRLESELAALEQDNQKKAVSFSRRKGEPDVDD